MWNGNARHVPSSTGVLVTNANAVALRRELPHVKQSEIMIISQS